MKIVFVVSHLGLFVRHLSRVGLHLAKNGHSVTVLRDPVPQQSNNPDLKVSEGAILALQRDIEGLEIGSTQVRNDWWWRKTLRLSRELLNYAFFMNPCHPSPSLINRGAAFVPNPARIAVKNPIAKRLLSRQWIVKRLQWIENLAPPGPNITQWLKINRPDVVVASPYIYPGSKQTDYVKAATSLGIPSIVPVASWDNLTTKGRFQILPSLVLVWNQALANEAVYLHDVPENIVRVTGAPTFDFMFDMKPSFDRESFCKRIGLDPNRPYVVYLGSSTTISGDETPYAHTFINCLKANPMTQDFSVLIRPHPLNGSIWDQFSAKNAVVWPQGGRTNDTLDSRNDYFHTLYHSVAVVGVNTSALLETAIVDRPCIAILTHHYRAVQTEIGHFHHLLKGGFLNIVDTFKEAAQLLNTIHNGSDLKAEDRGRFVGEFIRPWGTNQESSTIMADIIEAVAHDDSTEQWAIEKVQQSAAMEIH